MLKGVFCLMICASLAFPAAADDTLEDGRFSGSGGFITNPTGLFLRHDYSLATTLLPTILGEGFWGDVEVGVYHLYQVFSNEFGAQLAWQTEPALLRLSLDMGFEPGAFIEVDQTQSGVIYDTDSTRASHLRRILRAQALVNFKLDSFWIYSRSSVLFRDRDFVEYDAFQEVTLQREVQLEQATALFLPVVELPALAKKDGLRSRLWGYGEYTVGTLLGTDVRPNRVSMGVVTENFPAPYVGVNLDVFYSFANAPITGPGVIFVYFFAF